MPEIIRGSRSAQGGINPNNARRPSRPQLSTPDRVLSEEAVASPSPARPEHAAVSPSPHRHVAFSGAPEDDNDDAPTSPISPTATGRGRRRSSGFFRRDSSLRRRDEQEEAEAYYDSRAATKREFRRRGTTLQDYYNNNPELLPQLPFTWHRGKKRYRLFALIVFMWIDACVVPIALYYAMYYGGQVQNWITFAVITTIWGGPTYLEFAVRTLMLMKKERFYRPLGTNSRWCFDLTTWASSLTIFAVTALFIVGSAPHVVWLRVLCMPAPAILYVLGGIVGGITLYHSRGWKAPFRISSTGKGETVRPGVYYFIEDVVAVNARAGRPFREALSARYEASPRFRRMLYIQSIFWSVPALGLAIPLTVIAVIHPVPSTIAYGICWAVPFIWATIWAFISVAWVKRDMARERTEWELDKVPDGKPLDEKSPSPSPTNQV